MPDISKGRGQKCSLWSSRLGVGRGAYEPSPGKFTVTKPPAENSGGGQDQHSAAAPVKEKKLTAITFSESTYNKSRWFTVLLKVCEFTARLQITLQNSVTSNTIMS
jgi:hypothetical protein